jgi:RimJ/RimL family protein N-acetyltransferase
MRWLNADLNFLPYLAEALQITPTASACQLAEFDDEVPIAGVLFDGYIGRSIHAHIWINPAHRPSRLFYWAICDYAFNQLAVSNVVGTVPSSCERAVRLNRHLGFRSVGRIADYYPNSDDMIIMVCTSESVFDFGRLKPKQHELSDATIAA